MALTHPIMKHNMSKKHVLKLIQYVENCLWIIICQFNLTIKIQWENFGRTFYQFSETNSTNFRRNWCFFCEIQFQNNIQIHLSNLKKSFVDCGNWGKKSLKSHTNRHGVSDIHFVRPIYLQKIVQISLRCRAKERGKIQLRFEAKKNHFTQLYIRKKTVSFYPEQEKIKLYIRGGIQVSYKCYMSKKSPTK